VNTEKPWVYCLLQNRNSKRTRRLIIQMLRKPKKWFDQWFWKPMYKFHFLMEFARVSSFFKLFNLCAWFISLDNWWISPWLQMHSANSFYGPHKEFSEGLYNYHRPHFESCHYAYHNIIVGNGKIYNFKMKKTNSFFEKNNNYLFCQCGNWP